MARLRYIGIGPEKGEVVEEEQAFEYALERCLFGSQEDKREFKSMLIEWFFSGNFIKEEKENE